MKPINQEIKTQSSAVKHSESEEKPNEETKVKVSRQKWSVMTAAQVLLNSNSERVAFFFFWFIAQCANFDPSERQNSLQLKPVSLLLVN
ncbi:hypothetical protein AVEN_264434-1 [Araneus ventricosus]|uniref:Uncharacterized protein n=1 Tax=Araneus ventricosus TaxID=182803 RepID=A0A4Y2B7X1_ARAVE|nr:hypothetical protein AVEN_264434-1 [Araneus ventricosus]